MNKTARIEFVMTEEDAARLKEYAKKCRLSVSGLLRMLINGYRPKEAPDDKFFDDLNRIIEEAEEMRHIAELSKDPDKRQLLNDVAYNLDSLTMEIRRKYLSPEIIKKIL